MREKKGSYLFPGKKKRSALERHKPEDFLRAKGSGYNEQILSIYYSLN